MRKEFVMRGQTASGGQEVLNFGKYKEGYGYIMTGFELYPSTAIGSAAYENSGSVTAGKTAVTPTAPNFDDAGLIATAYANSNASPDGDFRAVINHTYIITQNLILMVQDAAAGGVPVNWQCTFKSVKMTGAEEAATNYKQFTVSDE